MEKMNVRNTFLVLVMAMSVVISACSNGETLNPTPIPTLTFTFTPTPLPTLTPIPQPTFTKTPVPSPTKNPYGYNGYWVSPIDEGTNAYIKTYGNICAQYENGCIQNWKGDKGEYPKDFYKLMTCPFHSFGWDFIWDHPGQNVYAVQGGKVFEISLDGGKPGVKFFIVDERKNGRRYAADYGHVNGYSLVQNGIISEQLLEQVFAGKFINGSAVSEGQLLGVTGDGCCSFGVLHISTGWDLWGTDPSKLWQFGEWPDFNDSLHPIYGTRQQSCGD